MSKREQVNVGSYSSSKHDIESVCLRFMFKKHKMFLSYINVNIAICVHITIITKIVRAALVIVDIFVMAFVILLLLPPFVG